MKSKLKPFWVLSSILLLSIATTQTSAEDYTKRFVRGVYGGNANSTQDETNHNALHLNYLFSYPVISGSYNLYCSEEWETQHAVVAYSPSAYDGRVRTATSLYDWKTRVVSDELGDVDTKNYVNLCGHYLGEESPEFYDKIYFDAMSYVISKAKEKWPGDLITCEANQGSIRPDLFLWVKDIDVAYVYPYPFNTTFDTDDSWYQDSLQSRAVNYYNHVANQMKMFRQWGMCPNLYMRTCPQHWFYGYMTPPPPDKIHLRMPNRKELLFEGWLAFSRGAKGLVPFRYQTGANADNNSGMVGLVDNGEMYYGSSHLPLPFTDEYENWCCLAYKDSEGHIITSEPFCAEETGWDADEMFKWSAELFSKLEIVDNRLKNTYYNYTNGLYDVDMDTFQSIQGDMTSPFFFVRQIVVEPPSGKTAEEVYTELSLHHSPYGHNFFLLLNRSLHFTSAVGYQITLLHTLQENPKVVNLVTGTTYTPPLQGNEYKIHVTLGPGEAGFFIITNESEGGNERELYLSGEWRDMMVSSSTMNHGSFGNSNGFAICKWQWFKGKPSNISGKSTWKHTCSETEWEPGPTDFALAVNGDWGIFIDAMESTCMNYIKVIEHTEDPYDVLDDIPGEPNGTESNVVTVQKPENSGGCPDLYSYVYHDTTQPAGYLFVENNTILPHSPHVQAAANDFLKLDALNTEPDHYYMNVLENSTSTSYIDMTKLWAVDHEEGTEVATSANDSIYVYSEIAVPTSCTDNSSNDRLGEVLWEDTASFGGTDGSYLTVEFDDPGWTHVGLLVTTGIRGHPQPPDKDFYSVPQDSGASGWDSLGVLFGRLNPYDWVVDVSESEDFTFRITNHGDTAWLDRIALVKLEDTGWTKQVAPLDSAVLWDYTGEDIDVIVSTPKLTMADDTCVILEVCDQISLRFDKLDTTSFLRDFVLETKGWYSPEQAGGPQFGGKAEIPFGLDIKQIKPFSNLSEIRYSVPYKTNVKIAVYDVSGRLVKELVDKESTPGYHRMTWEGEDYADRHVSAGLYFVRMTADKYKAIRKLVVLR